MTSQIFNRKHAFASYIRQNVLQRMKSRIRNEIALEREAEMQVNTDGALSKLVEALNQKPLSTYTVCSAVEAALNYPGAYQHLLHLRQAVFDKLKDCSVVEWNYLVYAINSLLLASTQTHNVSPFLKESLAVVVTTAHQWMKRDKMHIVETMRSAMTHIFLMTLDVLIHCEDQLLSTIGQLIAKSISLLRREEVLAEPDVAAEPLALLNRLLRFEVGYEKYANLMEMDRFMFETELRRREMFLVQTSLFDHPTAIRSLINVCYETEKTEFIEVALSALINCTFLIEDPCYLSALASQQITTLINFLCAVWAPDAKNHSKNLILLVKLMINLMVTSSTFTEEHFYELDLSRLQLLFEAGISELCQQIVQLYTGVIELMYQDSPFLQHLLNKKIQEIFFKSLQKNNVPPIKSAQLVSALSILYEKYPSKMQSLLDYSPRLTEWQDQFEDEQLSLKCERLNILIREHSIQ